VKHLVLNVEDERASEYWCDVEPSSRTEDTDDPRDATCPECLRAAAAYGAAAAMRWAAVEAGATRDPELEKERDHAIAELNKLQEELKKRGAFFCTGCSCLLRVEAIGLSIGTGAWCNACCSVKEAT
jgi:hypothetical protein